MKITTPDWVKDAVFYQIFPDRFAASSRVSKEGLNLETWESAPTPFGFKGGDLRGVTDHLDYLQELGITAIYLNPIFSSASNHRYHTYDYYNVDPLLGGNEALRELLDVAHARGIRVILDGVFNHASRGFWPFHHVLENGAGSPYVGWFHYDRDRLYGKKRWGAYPSASEERSIRKKGSLKAIGYQAWWDLPALPKFNTNTPAVRKFIFDVAEFWLKFGIDGWRLDVPHEIDDDAFWQEFRSRVKAINPQAYIVGEIWEESKRWLQGDQFDAVMNYPVTLAALGFLTGSSLDVEETNRAGGYRHKVHPLAAEDFAEQIDTILGWYDPAITQVQLNLLDSHDTPRFLTSAKNDKASLKLGLLFMFMYPGAPCIYYGDEVGMDGRQDPDCRKAFSWDKESWDLDLLTYTRSVIALRKTYVALRYGSYQRIYAAEGLYAFSRSLPSENLLIVLNTNKRTASLEIPLGVLNSSAPGLNIIFGNGLALMVDGKAQISVNARSGLVLKLG